ncbi:septation protein SepH [Nocardioides sp. TF02-7]|nr:septation protein SepH [Nocardioides sp. TF02-7]
MAAHLGAHDAKAQDVAWDAFRRDDGRWVLTGTFRTSRRSGAARFAFDVPGNYVVAENDDARWLVGDLVEPVAAAPRVDDLEQARQRRLAAVPADELPLGDDTLDLVGGEAAEALPADPAPAAYDEPLRDTTADPGADPNAPAAADPEPAAGDEPARRRRQVAKKRGRASVPSWDEIMFGSNE